MLTTSAVARRLVELCRQNLFVQAQHELMADHCVQHEPARASNTSAGSKAEIIAKEEALQSAVLEMHHIDISEPLVAGPFFSITLRIDLTLRDRGRLTLAEIGVYEVRDGLIVSETFFY
jgi:hypothetical protein